MRPASLAEAFVASVYQRRDEPAVLVPGQRLSWERLGRRVRGVARGLLDRGVEPGATLVVDTPDPVEGVVGALAAELVGATPADAGLRLGDDPELEARGGRADGDDPAPLDRAIRGRSRPAGAPVIWSARALVRHVGRLERVDGPVVWSDRTDRSPGVLRRVELAVVALAGGALALGPPDPGWLRRVQPHMGIASGRSWSALADALDAVGDVGAPPGLLTLARAARRAGVDSAAVRTLDATVGSRLLRTAGLHQLRAALAIDAGPETVHRLRAAGLPAEALVVQPSTAGATPAGDHDGEGAVVVGFGVVDRRGPRFEPLPGTALVRLAGGGFVVRDADRERPVAEGGPLADWIDGSIPTARR